MSQALIRDNLRLVLRPVFGVGGGQVVRGVGSVKRVRDTTQEDN